MSGSNKTKRNKVLGIEKQLENTPSIYISKALARLFGSNLAILYGELVSRYKYFDSKNQLTPDGYFFNTIEDLGKGTELGDKPQRAAINKLQELGLIEFKLRGLPAKRYFKILDTPKLAEYLEEGERLISEDYKDRNEDTSFAQKKILGISKRGVNNTKTNNYKINKTTPPAAVGQVDNELSKDFIVEIEKEEITTKTKPINKKIEAGEYERITPRDIYDYFRNKYTKQYKRYPNNSSDLRKTLAILKRGFLDKYGGQMCIELIDLMLERYGSLDIDFSNYPRPEIPSLTQDWLINKLLDKEKEEEENKGSKAEEVEEYIELGPYEPMKKLPSDTLIISNLTNYNLITLARKGYLPPGWFDLFRKSPNEARKIIGEEAIPEWNKNNDYQMST